MIDYDNKYKFKPYKTQYLYLAQDEIQRIKNTCMFQIRIEHVGSTAVPSLGGKGIVDLYCTTEKTQLPKLYSNLEKLGYEHKASGGQAGVRVFFQTELDGQLYHVHVGENNSADFDSCLLFRDFLHTHPEAIQEYEAVKKKASEKAQLVTTKEEKKKIYMKEKETFIQRNTKRALKN